MYKFFIPLLIGILLLNSIEVNAETSDKNDNVIKEVKVMEQEVIRRNIVNLDLLAIMVDDMKKRCNSKNTQFGCEASSVSTYTNLDGNKTFYKFYIKYDDHGYAIYIVETDLNQFPAYQDKIIGKMFEDFRYGYYPFTKVWAN